MRNCLLSRSASGFQYARCVRDIPGFVSRIGSRSIHNMVKPLTKSDSPSVEKTSVPVESECHPDSDAEPHTDNEIEISNADVLEAMKNLKTMGIDHILNSAMSQWLKLKVHGDKPYIKPEIEDQWRKSVIVQ
jgi:hypothetical protein